MEPPADRHPAENVRLWLRHQDAIFGYILASTNNASDADDVFQNTALAAIQSEECPKDDARFLAWAREVARRRILEFYRRTQRIALVEPQLVDRLAEVADRVESETPSLRRRSALMTCLERLSENNRELLTHHYGDRTATASILAKRFGRSEQGIYSLLYRLRKTLRDCIDHRLALEEA